MERKNQEKKNREYEETVHFIKQGLEQMDRMIPATPPNLRVLKQQIAEQKKLLKKKWYRDLTLFSCIAIIILTSLIFILYQQPIVFIAIQVITVLSTVIYTTELYRRQQVNRS